MTYTVEEILYRCRDCGVNVLFQIDLSVLCIQDKWFVVVVRNWSGFKSVLVRVMIRALHSSYTKVIQTVCVNKSSMSTN